MPNDTHLQFSTYNLRNGELDHRLVILSVIREKIPYFDHMLKLGLYFKLGERLFRAFKNFNIVKQGLEKGIGLKQNEKKKIYL